MIKFSPVQEKRAVLLLFGIFLVLVWIAYTSSVRASREAYPLSQAVSDDSSSSTDSIPAQSGATHQARDVSALEPTSPSDDITGTFRCSDTMVKPWDRQNTIIRRPETMEFRGSKCYLSGVPIGDVVGDVSVNDGKMTIQFGMFFDKYQIVDAEHLDTDPSTASECRHYEKVSNGQ